MFREKVPDILKPRVNRDSNQTPRQMTANENRSSSCSSEKSASVVSTCEPPGFSRSRSSISFEASTP